MGQDTYQGIGNMSYGSGNSQTGSNHSRGKQTKRNRHSNITFGGVNKKAVLTITGILLVLIAIVGIFILVQTVIQAKPAEKQTYIIEGQWFCREAEDLEDALENLISEQFGYDEEDTNYAMYQFGLSQIGENVGFDFGTDGSLTLRFADVAVDVDAISRWIAFSYEERSDNKLELTFAVPDYVNVSYLAEYRMGEDWLILDFFGKKLEFYR